MRRFALGTVLALVAGGFVGSALAGGECCDKAKAENAWCGHCKTGFFAGQVIKSEGLHKALAGTPAPADAKCDGCKKAMAANGTCDHCHVAFANKMMYHSMVAHDLAIGTCTAEKDMKCEACKKNAAGNGWCDACKKGMVGCFAFSDKAAYDKAVTALNTLKEAMKAADKCEGCAVAMVTDGKCAKCNVSYKGGKKVEGAAKP